MSGNSQAKRAAIRDAERAKIAAQILAYADRADGESSLYWEGWYDGVCEAYELVRGGAGLHLFGAAPSSEPVLLGQTEETRP